MVSCPIMAMAGGLALAVATGGVAFVASAGLYGAVAAGGTVVAGKRAVQAAAERMDRATAAVGDFAIHPLGGRRGVCCSIFAPGWLSDVDAGVTTAWLKARPRDITRDMYAVNWNVEQLRQLYTALQRAEETATQTLQLFRMARSAFLNWTDRLVQLIDNPWLLVSTKSAACGLLLSRHLMAATTGRRPVTLVGVSHGAAVIAACLDELVQANALGIVQDVFLLGAPLSAADAQTWEGRRRVVAGRFVNAFHPKDYILLAASGAMLRTIAGTAPLNHKGIENVNVSDIVSSHLDYERKIQELGDKLQFWF
mmetsp:Transcript_53493/g.116221  ORF Transcript_53493/g.116221 Transcript_53493/m.116221 type:complete len:310 (+) Transcript_53493:3-932(+)